MIIENCIFCKIYQARSNILYEDNILFLLADAYPLSRGHLLFIPKEHTKSLHELSDGILSSVLVTIKKVVKSLGYQKYNMLQNNGHIQSVPHVHFHIIPANDDSSLLVKWETMKVDDETLELFRERVRKALS